MDIFIQYLKYFKTYHFPQIYKYLFLATSQVIKAFITFDAIPSIESFFRAKMLKYIYYFKIISSTNICIVM